VVTNYDSQVWKSGSFISTPGAIGAPTPGNNFSGIAVLFTPDQFNTTLRAVALETGVTYERRRVGAAPWTAWARTDQNLIDTKVAKAGDTMTGDLVIDKVTPVLRLNRRSGTAAVIQSTAGATFLGRWQIDIGNGDLENTGTNNGSNFAISRFSDAGGLLGVPLFVNRASGAVFVEADPASALQVSTKQYTDTKVALAGGTMTGNLVAPRVQINLAAATGARLDMGYDSSATAGICIRSSNASIAGELINFQAPSGGSPGRITFTGAQTGVAYATSSDARLKEDFKSFDAGNIIDNTNVYDFAWKSTGERSYGVIAQEAVNVYAAPTLHDEKEDRWFIDYSKYVPVMLQELKALRARVAALEAQLVPGTQPWAR
jgi:hypothetical protein